MPDIAASSVGTKIYVMFTGPRWGTRRCSRTAGLQLAPRSPPRQTVIQGTNSKPHVSLVKADSVADDLATHFQHPQYPEPRFRREIARSPGVMRLPTPRLGATAYRPPRKASPAVDRSASESPRKGTPRAFGVRGWKPSLLCPVAPGA